MRQEDHEFEVKKERKEGKKEEKEKLQDHTVIALLLARSERFLKLK